MRMTIIKRVDANQPEIVAALRAAGAHVIHTHHVGRGFPDIMVDYNGKSFLMEIKTQTGKLTKSQIAFHKIARENGAPVYIVRSVDEALAVLNETGQAD